ncbi:uncharacterized protein QC764_0110520 [Podospora pseudoanserina]|uniref:Uncharacterized protein n=1 Tax=Podospora pseudoanserina TaxID=2609844 RepID=A0ABR0HIG2_9PEZI|nr:hypothetical protein QC764_0110520 [Podospora pseudoanserina]
MNCKGASMAAFLLVASFGATLVEAGVLYVPSTGNHGQRTVTARSEDGEKDSNGAITGGVVGGVVGLLALSVLLWSFYARQTRNTPVANTNTSATTDSELEQLPKYQQFDPNQASKDNYSGPSAPEMKVGDGSPDLPEYTPDPPQQSEESVVPPTDSIPEPKTPVGNASTAQVNHA